MMRAGDQVLHGPTGETWVVAYVDGDYLGWCGWPAGEARLSDCTLIKAATDDEHIEWLHKIAQSDGKRARMAQRALEALHGKCSTAAKTAADTIAEERKP